MISFVTFHPRCSRTGFGLTVTHNHRNNQVRVVHNGAIGNSQCVSQFAPFMDGTGELGADVARKAGGGGKPGNEFGGTLLVTRKRRIEWVKRVFEP